MGLKGEVVLRVGTTGAGRGFTGISLIIMRRPLSIVLTALLATTAGAQSSIAACGPLPDSTSRQLIKAYGDLRVCIVATKVVGTEAETPGEWAAKGSVVILETQRPGDNRRSAIVGNTVDWTINGQKAPQDNLSDRWQKAVIELLNASFDADELRVQATSLQEQIDSLPARRDAMAKRIRNIERVQAELNGQLLATQAAEARRRNDVMRLERQIDDYNRRGAAEERRASGLSNPQAKAAAEANARQYYQEAQRLGEQLRRLESSARSNDAELNRRGLEEELRSLTSDGNLALLRMKLDNYDSTKVEDLRALLTQLDAPQRLPALDARVEKARLDLLAVLEARGKGSSR